MSSIGAGANAVSYLADVQKLCEILAAEIDGRRIDQGEAHSLAQKLAEQCPDIAATLSSISQRMSALAAQASAA